MISMIQNYTISRSNNILYIIADEFKQILNNIFSPECFVISNLSSHIFCELSIIETETRRKIGIINVSKYGIEVYDYNTEIILYPIEHPKMFSDALKRVFNVSQRGSRFYSGLSRLADRYLAVKANIEYSN